MTDTEGFTPGDWVVYTDADHIEWGPWKITQILYDTVVLLVDDLLNQTVPIDAVRKFEQDETDRDF